MFRDLDRIETYLLAIHTLFDTRASNASKVKGVIERLEGSAFNDMKRCQSALKARGLLEAKGYNWRTDTYDYCVTEHSLVPAMLFLHEERPREAVKVLDAVGAKLKPTAMQRLLWEYITSGFKKIDTETLIEYERLHEISVLEPVVPDQRFAPLLMTLQKDKFLSLMELHVDTLFDRQETSDADYLRSLVRSYKGDTAGDTTPRLLCQCDLYDYLLRGRRPEKLHATNKEHRIIAALHEAYQGQHAKAFEHFRKALQIQNQTEKPYRSSPPTPFFPHSIVNFFFVLTAFLAATDESRKRALALAKAAEKTRTAAAKTLHAMLCNTLPAKQLKDQLSTLLASASPADSVLAQLMSRYIGESPRAGDKTLPQWLVLRQEMRKYTPLDETTARQADEAYGPSGLLTSIYRRQEWENVLHDLMQLRTPSPPPNEKSVRIAYFMTDTANPRVSVRQQSMLKSGKWGAGKQIPMQQFLSGAVEGMSADDKEIARQARRESPYSYDLPIETVLPFMTEESRLYVGHYAPYSLVEVTEDMPYITLHHDADGFLISSNVSVGDVSRQVIITHRGAASINFIHLTDDQRPYYRRLLSLGHFPAEAEGQLREFLKGIGGKIEVNSDLIEGGSTLPLAEGNAQLVMQMRPIDKETYAVSVFCRPLEGGRIRCTPGQGNDMIIDQAPLVPPERGDVGGGTPPLGGGVRGVRTRVKRNLEAETANLRTLKEHVKEQVLCSIDYLGVGTVEMPYYDLLPILEFAQQHTDLMVCEWPEGSQMKIRHRNHKSTWSGAIKKNENGWFEIEGNIELDQNKVVSMAQLLDLASQTQGRFIKLGDGEFLALSESLRRQLEQLSTIASHSRGKLQMSPFSAALIGADMLDGELVLTEDDELKKIRQRILEAGKYSPPVPEGLTATLRNYQLEGYQWMSRLNKWGAGALLADDMGLGKTVQTIAVLLQKAAEGPALVVAPASVAPNWKTELEKFAPSLHVTMLNFVGDRTDAIKHAKAGEVVVTTYGLLLSVKDDIIRKHWTTICLDEAHIIKNRGAKTSAVAMKLQGDNRIMLTGTPVQNHLGELWNLFQFVNPGLLGSFEDFNRRFIQPIEQNDDRERQHALDRLVKPFMLRRTKDKVAKELPEKEEIYQHVDLSEDEQLVYEAMRQKAEALLLAEGGGTVSMFTLAEITRLRQCACDVRLVEPHCQPLVPPPVPPRGEAITSAAEVSTLPLGGAGRGAGSKITALLELLATIIEADGSALVFSQFTSYLALVKQALDAAHISYLYIDGSVDIKTRSELVKRFQDGEVPVFLISLKAGGLGLNLTRANYVVHMDPWWNPAIEAQATDRAHRIGQQQRVTVYHLIAANTIEEKIQRLHERKQALVENILEATDTSHKLTGEELLEMVRSAH